MAERTPEQVNNLVDGLGKAVAAGLGNVVNELEDHLESGIFSEEFKAEVDSEILLGRYRGIIEGIQYARGEIDLPDIEDVAVIYRNRPSTNDLDAAMERHLGPIRDAGVLDYPSQTPIDHISPGA